MGDAVLNIAGDSAGAQKAIDALRKEVNRLKEELKAVSEGQKQSVSQTGQLAREAGRFLADLGKQAKKTWEETATPMERHKQQLAALEGIYQKGAMSVGRYAAAKEQLIGTLKREAAEGARTQRLFSLNEQSRLQLLTLGQMSAAQSAGKITKEHGMVSGLLGTIGAQVVGLGSAYLSVYGVIRAITGELEHQEQLRERSKQVVGDLATAQREFLLNYLSAMPPGTTKEAKTAAGQAAVARIAELSVKTGVSEADLTTRASAIFSSRQGATEDQAWAAVEESARVQPGNAASGLAFGVGAMDIMKVAKGVSARRAAGLIAATSGLSHLWRWDLIAQAGAPAISAIAATGGTPEEAAQWFAWTTLASRDWTGEQSKTASSRMTLSLEEWLPEKDRPIVGEIEGRLMNLGTRKGTGLKSPFERIDWMRAHPKEAAQIIEKMEWGRGIMKPHFRAAILDPESEQWKTLEDVRKGMGSREQLEADYESTMGAIAEMPAIDTAGFGRQAKTAEETLAGQDLPRATAGYSKEGVGGVLGRAESWPTRLAAGIERRFLSPRGQLVSDLARTQAQIGWRAGQRYGRFAGASLEEREPIDPAKVQELGKTERALLDALRRQEILLQRQLEKMDAQVKVQEDAARKGTAQGAGAVNTHTE